MGKSKMAGHYKTTIMFVALCVLMGTSLSFSGEREMSCSNFNLSLRRVAALQSARYLVSNYVTTFSAVERAKFNKDYPLNPEAGKWQELQVIWGEKADGVRDTHWLTLPTDGAQGLLDAIVEFAAKYKGRYSDVVVIGMGGSSRPGDVIRGVLGTKEGYARIHVMENLDQEDIQRVLSAIDTSKTLFISISKSGTTAETMALTQIAYDELVQYAKKKGLNQAEAEQFIAQHFLVITITSLEENLAKAIENGKSSEPQKQAKGIKFVDSKDEQNTYALIEQWKQELSSRTPKEVDLEIGKRLYAYLKSLSEANKITGSINNVIPALHQFMFDKGVSTENVFKHPDLVGGRYTIFSVIGLLPAALAGHDPAAILASAKRAMKSDAKYALGRFMADMEQGGRIYMRVILPDELKAIGPWIEQLVAESQGKKTKSEESKGILPIMERDYDVSVYTKETFAFRIKIGDSDANDGFVRQVIERGVPVWEFTVTSKEEALGLLYALEFATGMSGILMGIQPFDQPGVEAGKKATNSMKAAMLSEIEQRGISTQQAYEEELGKYRSKHRVQIADGVYLDYGTFMALRGADFQRFTEEKGIADLNSLSPTELYALLLLYAREQTDKTYGAILPYAVETSKRAEVWKIARGTLRQAGMQDLFGVGPLYEHSYRQYFMQGHDRGFFTFIVSTDPGTQTIPGEKIHGFTTGMQNALQALGTQKALADSGRYTVRIEIEGPLTEEKLQALQEFFAEVRRP